MDLATPKNSPLQEILDKIQNKQTPEQKKELEHKRRLYRDAVNSVFCTTEGRFVIKNMLGYVRYWDSVFNYKDDDRLIIQAQKELVRELILRELSEENLASLIAETRKGVN